jgi:hypothetical protein
MYKTTINFGALELWDDIKSGLGEACSLLMYSIYSGASLDERMYPVGIDVTWTLETQ